MRDAHMLKEKVQVSLDNRQVASLVVACLVILGLTFGVGVVVGRKLAPPPLPPDAPRDVLAEVDQKAKEPPFDPAKELTYRQELTKVTDPPAPTKVEAPPKAVAVAPAKPAELEKHPDEGTGPARATADVESADEPAEATPSNAAVPIPERDRPMPDKLKSATAVSSSQFSIQVAASQDKAEADGVVQKLRSSGYAPYVLDVTLPGKGRWYRVRLGHFGAKGDAEKYLKDFKRETRLDAIVTAAR